MVPSVAQPGADQRDDLDALFDIDPGMDELFEQLHENRSTDGNNTRKPIREGSVAARRDEGLGLDEEVKITKKRQPVAKLDATRCVSKHCV
jgi:replication fork protection complex subunit Csm3/Swi3